MEMAKNGKSGENEELERIRKHGVYFYPPGAIMHELHIAADGAMTRRSALEGFILCEDPVPCCHVGGRYYIRVDAWNDWIKEHEQPHEKGRPRGRHAK
jgi:hypothetical protein